MKQIYCIGNGVADIVVRPFDQLPKPGTSMKVDPIILRTGGCALNPAVTLKKLGADPVLTCKLGRDEFGEFVVRSLEKEGLDTSKLVFHAPGEGNTHVSLVCVSSNGERSFIGGNDQGERVKAQELDEQTLQSADIMFFSGATSMMDYRDGTPWLLKRLREDGKIIVTDSIGFGFDGDDLPGFIRAAASYTDYFMPSREEAEDWSGKTDPLEMAQVFRSWGAKNVVIKLNKEGAFYLAESGEHGIVPAYVVEAVDTNGAGDAFCGGFLMALSLDRPFTACLKIANATAAHCVMKRGATDGIVPLAQVEQFIIRRESGAKA